MIDVKAQRAVDNLNQLKTLIKSGDDVAFVVNTVFTSLRIC